MNEYITLLIVNWISDITRDFTNGNLGGDTINGRIKSLTKFYLSISIYKLCILLCIFTYTNYTIIHN